MADLLKTSFKHRDGCFQPPPPARSPDVDAWLRSFAEHGDRTGVACPQCRTAEIRYNGNYFCENFACGWAMMPGPPSGPECEGCEEVFNLCYLGLMDDREGKDPTLRWARLAGYDCSAGIGSGAAKSSGHG